MITIYTGVPGSGKSCHVSKEMCSWLRDGRHVLANFDFVAEPWEAYFHRIPDDPDYDELIAEFARIPRAHKEHNAVLVLDECQRIFNSRTWNDKGRMRWVRLFTLSRHAGIDVVLIAQDAAMVDKQIRACIQTEVRHMRVSAMGMIPFVMSGFGLLPLCFWVEKYYGSRIKVASGFFLPRARWWERYDSYDLTFIDELLPREGGEFAEGEEGYPPPLLGPEGV